MKPPITLLLLLSITCLSANSFTQANVGQQRVLNHYRVLKQSKNELLCGAKVYNKDAKGVSRATTHDDISQFAIGFFQNTLQKSEIDTRNHINNIINKYLWMEQWNNGIMGLASSVPLTQIK